VAGAGVEAKAGAIRAASSKRGFMRLITGL